MKDFSDILVQLLPALLFGLLLGPVLVAVAMAHYVLTMSREVAHGREMEAMRMQTDLEMEMNRHESGEPEQDELSATEPAKEAADAKPPE